VSSVFDLGFGGSIDEQKPLQNGLDILHHCQVNPFQQRGVLKYAIDSSHLSHSAWRQLKHLRVLLSTFGRSVMNQLVIFTKPYFVVMTRQNPVPGRQDIQASPDLALIPLLDMFNHEEGEITCHFDVSQQHMELTAKRPFQQGEQVFICYGNRSNSELLLYSGFVPDYNSKDRIK
jgi:hypothetical protein